MSDQLTAFNVDPTLMYRRRFAIVSTHMPTLNSGYYPTFDDNLVINAYVQNVTSSGGFANSVIVNPGRSDTNGGVLKRLTLVQIRGTVQVEVGGTFYAGDPIATDATGKAILATGNAYIIGYALETITSYRLPNRQYAFVSLTSMNTSTDGRGHFAANGTSLTATRVNGFGSVSVAGSSTRGFVTLNTLTGFPATSAVIHTFGDAYASPPTVLITPTSSVTSAASPYVSATTTTDFTVTFTSTTASQTYTYNYLVIA